MTVVYLDMLFLMNWVIDYLILLASGRLAGEVLRRSRIALGAAAGAVYSAAVFLPGMGFLESPAVKISAAVFMVLAAYAQSRKLLRVSVAFFVVSAAFGGGVFALELLGNRKLELKNGIFYSVMDLRLILLSAAVSYAVITMVMQRCGKHTRISGEIRPAILTMCGRRAVLQVLVDTGNTLTDPATGRPVLVAEGECLRELFPPGMAPDRMLLQDPVSAIELIGTSELRKRCRLISYRAVGVECGMLLAIRLDGVNIGGEEYGSILAALSPNAIADGGNYQALIGA